MKTRYLRAKLDGFEWEISITVDPALPGGCLPTIILYREPLPDAGHLDAVAVGRWDGERIQVHEWKRLRSAVRLEPHKDLPLLAEMLRTEMQP